MEPVIIGILGVAVAALWGVAWIHHRITASANYGHHAIDGAGPLAHARVEFVSRRRRVRPRRLRGAAGAYPRVTPATKPAPPREDYMLEHSFVCPTRREP